MKGEMPSNATSLSTRQKRIVTKSLMILPIIDTVFTQSIENKWYRSIAISIQTITCTCTINDTV